MHLSNHHLNIVFFLFLSGTFMPAHNSMDIRTGFHFSRTCVFNVSVLAQAFCSRLCMFPHKGIFCASFDSWFNHVFPAAVRRLWRRALVINSTICRSHNGKSCWLMSKSNDFDWLLWANEITVNNILAVSNADNKFKVIYSCCVSYINYIAVMVYKNPINWWNTRKVFSNHYPRGQISWYHGNINIWWWIWFYSFAEHYL